ncbi:T9SS type A sorting domain-containing protein [candidate division KSB1 bacterium]|nr:T9SS type A sorting domain-containing protein [candidate division KSB1 bacterium]
MTSKYGTFYKSMNGGTSWEKKENGLLTSGNSFHGLHAIAINPTNHLTLYAGTACGIFKSVDGAENWTQVNSNNTTSIAIDPNNTNILYATANLLLKSENAGDSWDDLGVGINGKADIVIDPQNSNIIYLSSYWVSWNETGGIYKSQDAGLSWELLQSAQYGVGCLAISSGSPRYLYGGTSQSVLIIPLAVDLPPAWQYTDQTGNNATIILPISTNPTIDGAPLAAADYIGVFTPAGLCCGVTQWQGANKSITAWGDDTQTTEIDGLQTGELIHYRVYRAIQSKEWNSISVAYSQGTGFYSANEIMVLSKFENIPTVVRNAAESLIPTAYKLLQNYPNPFNPETTIEYHLPQKAEVLLTIYDINGQEVIQLINGIKSAGIHSVRWNGRDEMVRLLASGVYFCSIKARKTDTGNASFLEIRKMILLK